MTDTQPDDDGDDRSGIEQIADLVIYVPLGLALEARRLFPEMAARGRRQVLFTRTVGKYAVRRGQVRLDNLVGTGVGLVSAFLPHRGPDEAPPTITDVETATNLAVVEEEPIPAGPDSDHLAIPDYDNLSAFQVMPRLEALDATDLDAVRAYEESTRGRRTILNKIAQLS